MAELQLIDRQKEQWALLRNPAGPAARGLAVFVHGFLGNYLTTWGRLPGLLTENAANDSVLAGWDYLFLGYSTRQVTAYLDIAKVIASHWDMASRGRPPYDRSYAKLSLFGHSLGTLGIRQLLCAGTLQPAGMLQALHSVTLFGTPLNGSLLAYGGSLLGGEIAEALKPGNAQLRMLRSWNDSVQGHYRWQDVRIVLGSEDKVVGSKYSDLIQFAGDAKPAISLNFDHSELVKPSSWTDSTIKDEIVGALS